MRSPHLKVANIIPARGKEQGHVLISLIYALNEARRLAEPERARTILEFASPLLLTRGNVEPIMGYNKSSARKKILEKGTGMAGGVLEARETRKGRRKKKKEKKGVAHLLAPADVGSGSSSGHA